MHFPFCIERQRKICRRLNDTSKINQRERHRTSSVVQLYGGAVLPGATDLMWLTPPITVMIGGRNTRGIE